MSTIPTERTGAGRPVLSGWPPVCLLAKKILAWELVVIGNILGLRLWSVESNL